MDSKIKSFTDLDAWKEGHALVLLTYKITKKFPRDEVFGLISQMRRAAVSITSNIAEGFSRQNIGEKIQFYAISQSSTTELINQIMISKDIDYINVEEYDPYYQQAIKTNMIICGLLRKLKLK